MLPIPNLDDRFFDEIVDEARMLIPALMPTWTDENVHDPGITFIELLAWLVEMQQYYMNRIVDKSEINFLKLLGTELKEVKSAQVDVTLAEITEEMVLPKGTKFGAKELIFETDESHTLIANKIEKIIVRSGAETNDYTSLNDHNRDSFYAFGSNIMKGNTLFIGFEKSLAIYQKLALTFYMFDEYPVQIGADDDKTEQIHSSAQVKWSYFGESNDKDKYKRRGWYPLEIIEDETCHLTKSGRLKLKVPSIMHPETIYPANDKGRFWISCTVEDTRFELSPRMEQVLLNTFVTKHRETLCESFLFHGEDMQKKSIELTDYLSFYEKLLVQVKDKDGYWHDWHEVHDKNELSAHSCSYLKVKNEKTKRTTILLGEEKSQEIDKVRVVSYQHSFETTRYIGASNGLPNQSFDIYDLDILPETFMLQVGRRIAKTAEIVWEDWIRVNDFMNSSPRDLHFIYDELNQKIIFGNNEKGMIPEESEEDNICIIQCQLGGGIKGNIKPFLIDEIISEDESTQQLHVTNYHFATGGREKETIQEAKLRFQQELEKQERAVTSHDFEMIAKQTPGLRVARVKAIPLYTVGLKDYPNNKVPAQVTVVVVPYSESTKPIPSLGFLHAVKHHLDKHRLVTTEVHVIPPEYIKITIYAVVVVEPYLKDEPTKIIQALEQLLHPLVQSAKSGGWDFGRPVYKSDIYGIINEIDGVTFVKDLWIEGDGRSFQKETSGNILIPPHGLVYSGQHQIEVISKNDL